MDSFTNKNEMTEKDKCKDGNTMNTNKDSSDYDGTNKYNESSIRFVFDDDKKEYATSVKSASFTSSYSEFYNHLSFNPETSTSAEICAICIDQYQQNDELRKLPCGHEFHREVNKKYIYIKILTLFL